MTTGTNVLQHIKHIKLMKINCIFQLKFGTVLDTMYKNMCIVKLKFITL